VQDSSTIIRIHADSNIVALLDVSVEDSTLTVRKDEKNLILEGDKYIYIACPSVRSVIGRGSGNFNTENFKLESLKINLSGSGNIFMKNGSLDGLEVRHIRFGQCRDGKYYLYFRHIYRDRRFREHQYQRHQWPGYSMQLCRLR
jgi:hypothetical protein